MPDFATQEPYRPMGPSKQIADKITRCLHRGCIVYIEHAATIGERFTDWKDFCEPCICDGDVEKVLNLLQRCCDAHAGHYVRLVLSDITCRTRAAFVVHEPELAMAA